jgi:hypothetical protein
MLSIGIVGLPNVGKSTLFKALTKKQVDISNYPFTTINPNIGVVAVPDERLEPLAKMSDSKKVVPAAVEFIDIAGLVKGAAAGEGLGNKFLAHIREANAIAEIVRIFEDENVAHVHQKIDPANDIGVVNTELMLADLETVNRHLEKVKKDPKDPKATLEISALNKLKNGLERGIPAINVKLDEKEAPLAANLNLLTSKKTVYIFNVSEKQLEDEWQPDKNLLGAIAGSEYITLSAAFELLLSESSPEEQKAFMEELDLRESGLDSLIKKGYQSLELITFLTANEEAAHAWTVKTGTPIPKAAGVVHTDFENRFIRAEVINWRELSKIGSRATARQLGKLRTVGRDYIVQEGDVVEIKI